MSHQCKAFVLYCMDFRLTTDVHDFMVSLGLKNDYDGVRLAGGVLPIVRPENERDREYIFGHISLSNEKHGAKKVYLMNHTDCGAYGGKEDFKSEEEEKEQHTKDLKEAKKIVMEKFPELEVIMILAKIDEIGEIVFEVIN